MRLPGNMPLPFFERTTLAEHARQLNLGSYTPEIVLTGLVTGVDNLRHDVYLSPKLTELTRGHISHLIEKYGNVQDIVVEDSFAWAARAGAAPHVKLRGLVGAGVPPPPLPVSAPPPPPKPADRAAEFKKTLADLQIASLNLAKAGSNLSIDLLLRLAIVKLFRYELSNQFGQVLERCRAKLKSFEGPRAQAAKSLELRDRFLKLQVSKKIIIRKAGQDLFATLREVEKESVARMRRSLFGESECAAAYDLFQNRLIFTEDGRDDYLNAEQYVMLGNYERDPDRFETVVEIARDFLRNLELGHSTQEDEDDYLDSLLSVIENAHELFAAGNPADSSTRSKAQRALLTAWTSGLEQTGVIQQVLASYEVVPLLAEYSPLINPQQLKNALISRTERKRVEQLLEEHGKISSDKLQQAVRRMEGYNSSEKQKLAARYMTDFIRYHRDVRRLETVNSALDMVNVIANEKLRELSAINSTLFEFLLNEEQKPAEDKVIDHIILKADIRDSTTLTRTLSERGLNPASYFSLNFYEPVNKLLSKYSATKVFIEGDAIILAMFEHEGEPGFGVARACMMAREMIDIVNAYNEKSRASGLPSLELGIGICFQDSAPMYLMDGTTRIMISKALNESDRLSSCTKGARKYITSRTTPFNVFSFQTVEDADTGGMPDEFLMRYNIGGIHINAVAFEKLQQEISLQEHVFDLPMLWGLQKVKLYSGLVPVAAGVFHRIVIREGIIPHINASDFTVKRWTNLRYYEVCTNRYVYELVEGPHSVN